MEAIKPVFTTYQFDVEVVTPVHVGMAQEKHYLPGLDFLQKGDRLSFLNPDALFRALTENTGHLEAVTAKMATGDTAKLTEFLIGSQYLKAKNVLFREETVNTLGRTIRDIRRAFVTGLGQPAIPGTSVKGALRSVLVWHLTRGKAGLPAEWPKLDEQLFGKITANLMRYVQVSDIAFEPGDLKTYPVKVFSGDGNPQQGNTNGQWKHGKKRQHEPEFHPAYIARNENGGFFNFYESLIPSTSGSELRMSIGNNLQADWLQFAQSIDGYYAQIEKLTGNKLIELIRAHTAQYLQKERAYYKLFNNEDLNKNARRNMETRLTELESHNNADYSCLLRVGANVGFHSITGDWQDISQKHYEAWVQTEKIQNDRTINVVKLNGYSPMFYKERQQTTDHIFAKTRKFDIEQAEDVRDFLLPGFIKLTLQSTESGKTDSRQKTVQRITDFQQELLSKETKRMAAEAEAKRKEEEERVSKEAKRRKPFEGKVKKGSTPYAEVIAINGSKATLKLFVTAEVNEPLTINYNGLTVGQLIQVEVKDVSGKGKVMAVGFKSL